MFVFILIDYFIIIFAVVAYSKQFSRRLKKTAPLRRSEVSCRFSQRQRCAPTAPLRLPSFSCRSHGVGGSRTRTVWLLHSSRENEYSGCGCCSQQWQLGVPLSTWSRSVAMFSRMSRLCANTIVLHPQDGPPVAVLDVFLSPRKVASLSTVV